MVERLQTVIKIDPEIWKQFKIRCIKLDEKTGDRLAKLIMEDLKNGKK